MTDSTFEVIGLAQVGQTLDATPGLAYQWYSNGVAIAGATGPTYLIGSQDVGAVITVDRIDSSMQTSNVVAASGISFGSNGAYASSATSSLTLAKPAGVVSGNLMLMFVTVQTKVAAGTISTPAGWALVTNVNTPDNGAGFFTNMYLFSLVAGASEPANYSVSYGSGGTLVGLDGRIRSYVGASAINSSAVVANSASSATTVVPALSETFVAGEWYVLCVMSINNALPTSVMPALANVVSVGGLWESYYIGDFVPGSMPGSETITYAAAIIGRSAIGVSIKP